VSAYADSSFILKLYFTDGDDARAATYMERVSEPLLLTAVQEAEVRNALRLRVPQRRSTSQEVSSALAYFERDISDGIYGWCDPDWLAVFKSIEQISRKYTERDAHRFPDLLHVACALNVKAKSFLSFDQRQSKLAKNLGMKTPF
jgi:predicted nucleic acid-binding protein